jgi:hypothetical protein
MVKGLLIQTVGTAIKILTLKRIANKAASNIWKGIGITAQNKPIAIAPDTDRRFICQIPGSCSFGPSFFISGFSVMLVGCGINFLIIFLGISRL